MRIIKFVILFLLFIALFILSYLNTQSVKFFIPFNTDYNIPLILLLFIFFLTGSCLGILSMLFRILRLRNQVAKLTKELAVERNKITQFITKEPTAIIVKDHLSD